MIDIFCVNIKASKEFKLSQKGGAVEIVELLKNQVKLELKLELLDELRGVNVPNEDMTIPKAAKRIASTRKRVEMILEFGRVPRKKFGERTEVFDYRDFMVARAKFLMHKERDQYPPVREKKTKNKKEVKKKVKL